jgi:nicotinamide riboside kinase
MRKLALTGGPSAGKTTLSQALLKQYSSRVAIVPEAASIVFGGGWPRRKTVDGVQHQQKAIYFLQRELEELIKNESDERLLVCDRGSLDGMAYWPGPGPGEDFLKAVDSTLDKECSRYDFVIHLDTAPQSYYDISNPLRSETFEEAWSLNERIKNAWAKHPQRFVISNDANADFMEKMRRALVVVREVIAGRSYQEIARTLAQIK